MSVQKKYSDQFTDWLVEAGYTHCFFVAGGNIMHLLDSVRTRMTCVPFVHEVAATIGAEYFNAARGEGAGRAFALVTAGPGLTNAMTGVAGAWQESRELLIVGGQVKSSDLANGDVRQRGIQEIDGVELVRSITKRAIRVERPAPKSEILEAIALGRSGRPGPVFVEMCLDAQAAAPLTGGEDRPIVIPEPTRVGAEGVAAVADMLGAASRPVVLIGGGVGHRGVRDLGDVTITAGIPLMTSWNGADRVPTEHPLYAGRPDTWGQRAANILLQQADLIIAVGARLSLQQTGFAWEEFAPVGNVVQVEIDPRELSKGHPVVDLPLEGDADSFLHDLYAALPAADGRWRAWTDFIASVREALPLNDPENVTEPGFVDPYRLAMDMCAVAGPDDLVLPGSSGGAATVAMQALQLRADQRLIGDKSLASMGYGLSGAIGAALANPTRRVFANEGDGGFSQNLQELGTVAANRLNLKLFVLVNNGYASIRMTQRNYFGGAWIGCDAETGLGLPDWADLARAYGIPYARMNPDELFGGAVGELLAASGPAFIEVPIDPEQTYYPKITSAVQADGSMRSNPLHLMSPELPDELAQRVLTHLRAVPTDVES